MCKLRYLLSFILITICIPSISADTYPKRELRSAWISTVWSLDWPRNSSGVVYATSSANITTQKTLLEEMITNLKAAGFNSVNFQVRSMCDAMYKSSYEPWSSALTGTRGTAPVSDWDPLAYCIELCHQNGMECHAWVNPFRFATSTTLHSTTLDKAIINKGWILTYGSTSVLNPGISEVRNYITAICQEIVENYNIDGMVWDDYFYPNGIPTNTEGYDYELWQNSGTSMTHGDWRRDNANQTIQQVYDMIQSKKPYIKFGISPAGVAEVGAAAHGLQIAGIPAKGYQYNGIFADPCAWILGGYIDYISPQLYWPIEHESAPYKPLCKWWQELAANNGVSCYISHDIAGSVSAWNNSATDYEERYNQIAYTRETVIDNNPGQVFFSSSYIAGPRTTGFNNYLTSNLYQYKSLPPKIVKDNEISSLVNPGKPQNFSRNSGTLSWDKFSEFYNMRYAVYAIPLSVNPLEAASTVHTEDGGYKSEYLLDITYTNSYTGVPTSGYWYAVTAIDCYGNEWEAATIDAPATTPVNLSIVSPESGIVADATSQSFSWIGDEGALFTLQISDNSNFANIVSESSTSNMSINLNTGALNENTTYYWRIVATRSGYITTTSETRTFSVPERPSLDVVLSSPQNGATIGEVSETFSWNAIDDATYLFEIASDNAFSDVKISQNLSSASYTLTTSDLNYTSAYYWRVTAIKSGYKNSLSETRTFLTPEAPRVVDPATYDVVDNITLKSLWINSLNTDNFPAELSSATNPRSMTALDGVVFVSNRTTTNIGELITFDGVTGEYLRTITLTGDYCYYANGDEISFPCNTIFTDGAEHLCVSNMVTSFNGNDHLTVCTIDVASGTTTRVFQSDITVENMRVDYAAAYGDVTSEGGQIWAAISIGSGVNNTRVYRWTRDASGNWTTEYTTIGTYYPTSATSNGYAPFVMPISDSEFILDGSTCNPTRYKFVADDTATLNDSFESNTTIKPTNSTANGMCAITLGDTPLFVYANNYYSNGSGYNYIIASNPSSYSFADMSKMWEIPQNGLGTTSTGWFRNDVAALNNNDGSVSIYTYTAKNGLAAYRLSMPQLEKVELLSPTKDEKTSKGFEFNWSYIDGATYTIEISQSLAFDDALIIKETSSNYLTTEDLNLLSEGTYYWRVKATKDGYTSSTSDAFWFIAPEIATWGRPIIWGPTDKETVNFDVSFVVTKTYTTNGTTREYADTTYLEISKTPDFSDLYFSGYGNWQENTHEGVIWLQYTVPVSYFTNGLYYWRARAVKKGWLDGVSNVRTFTVIEQSEELTSNYSMEREGCEYPVKAIGINGYSGSLTLTNLWIRSEEKGNALDATQATSGLYRGFCARHDNNGDQGYKDIIWCAGRTSDKVAFLDKYDAATGEYLGQLNLGSGYSTSYQPCNDVFLDDANNICINNMALANGRLQIATVNPTDGTVTERFYASVPERIDHARVIGDVTSGSFYVVAASPNSTIYRWTVTNGSITASETQSISSYYPSKNASTTISTFGTAPRIYPVNSSYFYIDGSNTSFTLYKWGQDSPVGSFASASSTEIIPTYNQGNGGTYFYHNGIPMIVYSYTDHNSSNGYKFNIAGLPNGHSDSFSGITKYYTIPNSFFGSTSNGGGDHAVLADYLQYDASTGYAITRSSTNDMTKIFLYVPGNGLAAYTLIQHIVTGEEQTLTTRQANITIANGLIHFGCEVESASLYSLSGALVSSTSNSSFMEAPGTNGVYILGINNNGINSTHKIIIK